MIERWKTEIRALANENVQLKFLLAQAPMLDAPVATDPTGRQRLAASRSQFAYIHPKTLAPFTWGLPPKTVYCFGVSPTKYVLLSLIPEGRVLYSPFQLPG